MSNIWLTQQYFFKNYSGWVDALKGQYLDEIYVVDPHTYCDSPDYNYDLPPGVGESEIILKLRNSHNFRVITDNEGNMMLLEDNTDTTKTICVEAFSDVDDEVILIDQPIWTLLDDIQAVEIIDVVPSIDLDETMDGVILILPSGNLCIKCDGWLETGVDSPRYIRRIEARKTLALMSDWLSQFSGYLDDVAFHSKGRNPDEKSVFKKLVDREDISSLFGRYRLGYSNNCLPSHQETSHILVELTLIYGTVIPEKIFDIVNWFCREGCNGTPKCEGCVISMYCNRNG